MAVPRVWSVSNPARLTRRNEPDSNDLCLDSAFVSDDVHVIAASSQQMSSRLCIRWGVHPGSAPLDTESLIPAVTMIRVWLMMCVPTFASSRLPNIGQDVSRST